MQRLARDAHAADRVPAVEPQAVRVRSAGEHNLADAARRGPGATVNSDDPAYFGGYMNENFVETFAALPQLGAAEAYALARNSFEASFVTADQRAHWISQLNASFDKAVEASAPQQQQVTICS